MGHTAQYGDVNYFIQCNMSVARVLYEEEEEWLPLYVNEGLV